MQLVLLLLIAGVGGYFLARSRFSEPIDDTAEKVAQTSRGWVDQAGDWWRQRFGKRAEVVDVESQWYDLVGAKAFFRQVTQPVVGWRTTAAPLRCI